MSKNRRTQRKSEWELELEAEGFLLVIFLSSVSKVAFFRLSLQGYLIEGKIASHLSPCRGVAKATTSPKEHGLEVDVRLLMTASDIS
jgi:hypothetical protein